METPLVSICSITYNHAPFIRQCLDGFLMQQCNFPIEIIINDDCSTDGTTAIIREYAEKYPDKIFPIFQEENLYSQGVRGMFQKFVFPKARGKYIALCEGDDYWTDPLKLQKQVDFLESHPDYSMCFHRVRVHYIGGIDGNDMFKHLQERSYTPREIIEQWSVPTCSVLARCNFIEKIPVDSQFCYSDNLFFLTCATLGKIYCMEKTMGVYNIHSMGYVAGKRLYELQVCHLNQFLALKRHFSFLPGLRFVLNQRISSILIYLLRVERGQNTVSALKYLWLAVKNCPLVFLKEIMKEKFRSEL